MISYEKVRKKYLATKDRLEDKYIKALDHKIFLAACGGSTHCAARCVTREENKIMTREFLDYLTKRYTDKGFTIKELDFFGEPYLSIYWD